MSVDELKNVSLVCKRFYELIGKSSNLMRNFKLKLSNDGIRRECRDRISRSCRRYKTIEITYLTCIKGSAKETFLSKPSAWRFLAAKSIKHLILHAVQVPEKVFLQIWKAVGESLETLNMKRVFITDDILEHENLLKNLKKLKHLHYVQSVPTTAKVLSLSHFPDTFETVVISGSDCLQVTNFLIRQKKLKTLELNHIHCIHEEDFEQPINCTFNLDRFVANGSYCKNHIKMLNSRVASSIKFVRFNISLEVEEFCEAINNMQQLESLEFWDDFVVSDYNLQCPSIKRVKIMAPCRDKIKFIQRLPNLEKLMLPNFFNYQATHQNIKALELEFFDPKIKLYFPSLTKLFIHNLMYKDFEQSSINFKQLVEIKFGFEAKLDATDFRRILRHMNSLKVLEIQNGSQLSDDIVNSLNLARNLRVLKIYNWTQLSDQIVSFLANQIGLRSYVTTEMKFERME